MKLPLILPLMLAALLLFLLACGSETEPNDLSTQNPTQVSTSGLGDSPNAIPTLPRSSPEGDGGASALSYPSNAPSSIVPPSTGSTGQGSSAPTEIIPSQVIPPMESLRTETVRCLRTHVQDFEAGKLFTPILRALVQCMSPEEIAQSRTYFPVAGGPPVQREFVCNADWYASVGAMLEYFGESLHLPSQSPTAAQVPIHFDEVASEAGVDFRHSRDNADINLGGGTAAGDYNGDGLLDIYVTNSAGPNALYRNDGDGRFTNVAAASGVDDPNARGYGAGWADYDNDGDLDLFVASFGASKLFRNDGQGSFTDVTSISRVGDPDLEHRTTGVTWGDYDNDGYLDLLVVRHAFEPGGDLPIDSEGLSVAVRPMALYHNNGDGTFSNMTSLLGDSKSTPSAILGAGFKPSFVDYDGDGDMDIYVVNDFGAANHPNVLWRNDGPGVGGSHQFTDVSEESGTDLAIFGMGLASGDFDNDGDVDFYMTDIGAGVLMVNQGNGTFENLTQESGTGRGAIPENWFDDMSVGWGAVFADFDNDSLLDLYFVAGHLDNDPCFNMVNQPNAVFINNGDGEFTDVSAASGANDPGTGRGVAYGDFNNDGRMDLFVVNVGSLDGTPGVSRLFMNNSTNSNHWLSIIIKGTTSNRDGIGARVTVTTGQVSQVREMGASQSHMSHSVTPLHFGMGASTIAEVIEIRWPSGQTQQLNDVPVDQVLTVVEP